MYGIIICCCLLLLRVEVAYPSLLLAFTFSGLESFLIHGRFGASSIILLPLTILGLSVRRYITITPAVTMGFIGFGLFLQLYVLPWCMATI